MGSWHVAHAQPYSEHPFSTALHPTDSRITIRRSSSDIIEQVLAAIHEAGHNFYETGLPQEHFGTPLGESVSLSVHESQSRLWEIMIGKSQWFAFHLYDILKSYTDAFSSPEELYQTINAVDFSPIRVQADDLTYPIHVLLRFDIEKDLMQGTLYARDIKERWNHDMQRLLGITPQSDNHGCLQDVHWSVGLIGYFPTYTLGTLYAANLYNAMSLSIPNFTQQLTCGIYTPVHQWLSKNIWKHARRYLSADLISRAIGHTPNENDFISYLQKKYLMIQP